MKTQLTPPSFAGLAAALALACTALSGRAQSSGITLGAATAPDPSAALEVVSSSKGALLPRLTEAARLAMGAGSVPAPAPGLIVYQTDGAQPGFWYASSASTWVRLSDQTTANGQYVQNQTSTAQAGGFRVAGTGLVDGALGVGTTTPEARLHVEAAGGFPVLLGGGANTGSELKLLRPGLAHLSLYNKNGALTIANTSSVSQTNSTGTPLMTIGSDGADGPGERVGIGTTNPASVLHVRNPFGSDVSTFESNSVGPHLQLLNPGGGQATIDYIGTGAGGTRAGALELRGQSSVQISGDGDVSSPDLTVGSSGNVGLGTTAPTARLDVRGDLQVQGSMSVQSRQEAVGNGTSTGVGTNIAQSFTLPMAATITSVRLVPLGSGIATLTFRSGDGPGGPVLGSPQTLVLTGSAATITLNSPLSLPSGTYTLLVSNMGNAQLADGDAYPGGSLYIDALHATANDLDFTVNYTVSAPVSTLTATTGGRVGIGTAAPGATLDVAGSSSTVRLQGLAGASTRLVTAAPDGTLGTQAAPDGTTFIQNQNAAEQTANFRMSGNGTLAGRLGLGTTSPLGRLHLVSDNGFWGDDYLFDEYNTGGDPTIYMRKSRGTPAAPQALVDGDFIGRLGFVAGIGGGLGYSSSASITSIYRGAGTADLRLVTTGGGLRISPAGNVGIGLSSDATQPLDVNGNIKANGNLQIPAANAYTYAAAKAQSLILGSTDFLPENSTSVKAIDYSNGGDNLMSGTNFGSFRAPVRLPQGAVITSFVVYYTDGNSNNLNVTMYSYALSTRTQTSLGSFTSSGTPGATSATVNVASGSTSPGVHYYLRAQLSAANANLNIAGVQVNYTVTQVE